ncbi:MAG: CesT family type III secretion system chaperone [Kiritimatiellae bacterium]|nr:CesT family type III secretion system chaperone [Kiritimatiellia bacterium]
MTAPAWIDSALGEFGRSAGLGSLSLGGRGVAALSFQNGLVLRFEHAFDSLYVSMTVPARLDASSAGRLLEYAHPNARFGFRLRSGYLAKTGRAVFAVRLADRDVTLPSLNAVFALLWRVALEFGGAS